MYKCLDCGKEFETPDTYEEMHGFTYGNGELFSICPICRSEAIATICEGCGKEMFDDDIFLCGVQELCIDCYRKVKKKK